MVERVFNPVEVLGVVPIVAGLIGAACNWGVARVLRESSKEDPAIRLAYVHNLGDTLVSLTPVAAGVAIIVSGNPLFDPVVALLIAAIIIVTTVRTIINWHEELIWPGNVSCGHGDSLPVKSK